MSVLLRCSVEDAESGSGCLLCGCLLLPPADFLALCSRLRWYRLTVSLRSISSCSAWACWYLVSQLTWCLRQPSIRCLSLSTTVLCLGIPTAPGGTTLPAPGFMLLLMQILPFGPAAGEAKSPITGPGGCYFERTFLPVKLTATSSSSGHLHLHHLVSFPCLSSPEKGPEQPGSRRELRRTTVAEASNNGGGLKSCEPGGHMVWGLTSDRLFFPPRSCCFQTNCSGKTLTTHSPSEPRAESNKKKKPLPRC